MFYDYIREQRSYEYIIRVAIRMYGWHRRLETRQTLVAATRIVCRVVMMMHGALLLYRQVLLHANHSVGVVVMGDNGCHQHDNVDKKQQSYYNSFLPTRRSSNTPVASNKMVFMAVSFRFREFIF